MTHIHLCTHHIGGLEVTHCHHRCAGGMWWPVSPGPAGGGGCGLLGWVLLALLGAAAVCAEPAACRQPTVWCRHPGVIW